MPAKRTEPSRAAISQTAGFKYTRSEKTNLAKSFAAIRRRQAQLERNAEELAFQQAQQQLDLGSAEDSGAQVLPLFKQAV